MKKNRFFDFEVTPNWWLCVFGDMPENIELNQNVKNDFVVITSDDLDARDNLLKYLRDEDYVKIGYNIKGYDLIIANGIYQGFTPQQIKIINDIIINPKSAWSTKEHMRMQPFAKKKLNNICYQDLMDDGAGSLKEKEATLGLSVLESSVDFNKENLTVEDKENMIYYCKQDVYASMQFYNIVVKPYTMTKLHLGKHFNIPEDTCYKSTNARLVSLALKAKRRTYLDENRTDIILPSKIVDYCYENLPTKILENIRTSTTGFKTELFENEVSFGNGGIHSTYKGVYSKSICLYIESDNEYCLVNVDAGSYYPSEMIQFNLLSRSVQNPQIFVDIYNERMMLKHKENKTIEEEGAQLADKLVLNTTFGASGNKWLDLYDPYMCTSVCRVGQIFLGALANKIFKTVKNSKIIQTNTDGILVYLPRKELPVLDKLQEEWTKLSGINMERDEVNKIWQRDVNNYLMVIDNNGKEKIKSKGGWLNDNYLRPGYVTTASANAYVCAKACKRFLLYNEDIIQNIVKNKNLQDFTITCTKGPTFRGVIQRFNDGTEKELYKANRVIAGKNKNLGMIYKYKMINDKVSYYKMPDIPEHCILVNDDLSNYNFDNDIKPNIDYLYYVERCSNMLDIEWYELKHNNLYKINKFDLNFN